MLPMNWTNWTPLKKLLFLHAVTRKKHTKEDPPAENTDSLGKNRGNWENVDGTEEEST